MTTTEHYGLSRPDPANDVDEEFYRLQQTLDQVDAIIFALKLIVDQKAAAIHGHAQADIVGLVEALAAKMNADRMFSLDDLADVDGAGAAATNYLLVKGADGQWRPSSAAAAIGAHQHATGDIVGLSALITSTIVAAFGGDADFATHVLADISARLPKAGGTMSGAIDMAGNSLVNAGPGVGNYVKGLITSKSSAYVISVAAGEIKGNGKLVINGGAFTKSLNAPWVAGSGNGGRLDAAAITASATYHLQALRKDSDGSFDWGYSLLPTPATVPAGYTWVGRFDWCYINSANTAIVDYTQVGNIKYAGDNLWTQLTGNLAAAKYQLPPAIPVPTGIITAINLTVDVGAGTGSTLSFNSGDGLNPIAASWSVRSVAGGNSTPVTSGASGRVKTDTVRQIWLAVGGFGTGSITMYVGSVEDYTLDRIY